MRHRIKHSISSLLIRCNRRNIMKSVTRILTLGLAFCLALVIYSCGQQENAPTSSTSPEGAALLKPISTDLYAGNTTTVAGSVTFAAKTPVCKITISLTGVHPSMTYDVYWREPADVQFLGQITADARGRGRLSETISGDFVSGTIHSLRVEVVGEGGWGYYTDFVDVDFK
jgi:hypothetical protein